MSASIAIPTLPSSSKAIQRTPKSVGSPSGSSYSQSPASSLASTPSSAMTAAPRRPSLLGDAFAKEESTVINIGDPEGPPRLISYLSSSQGFDWNPEIFLPSYIDCDYTPLENRREPVHEIRLTDEESKNMLPQ